MAKVARENLNRLLVSHLNTIHDTFQLLDETPPSSLEKISWPEVIKMSEQVSRQATVAGMLWVEETLNYQALEENMGSYFNVLQGFLLLSHGSKLGAGPTLSSCIQASAKQVVDSSFSFFKEAVSSYGSRTKDRKSLIPKLAGVVWEACDSLKKTPNSNYIAIGRAITQVAVSIKDVLRELNDLKPAPSDPTNETLDESTSELSPDQREEGDEEEEEEDDDDNGSGAGDLGSDLSPEEMKIAELAIDIVSNTLTVIKELIRFLTSLLNKHSELKNSNEAVNSLETLLKLCQEIGVQIDELGACLYPPQEVSSINNGIETISDRIRAIQVEVRGFGVPSESFSQASEDLESSVRKLQNELEISEKTLLVTEEMQNLAVSKT